MKPLALFVAAFVLVVPQRLAVRSVGTAPGGPGLLYSSDVVYVGSVKVPQVGGTDCLGSVGGGAGLAFDATGDGGLGTLFITGYGNSLYAACGSKYNVEEIKVPTTWSTSSSYAALPTAALAHTGPSVGFVDVAVGHGTDINGDPNGSLMGGIQVNGSELVINAYVYFGETPNHTSHMRVSKDVTAPAFIGGPYEVTTNGTTTGANLARCAPTAICREGITAGPMGLIPPGFQAALGGQWFTAQCCLAIISRSSNGPGFATFDPDDLGVSSPDAAGWMLLGYPNNHATLGNYTGSTTGTAQWFGGGTDLIGGVVFPPMARSVLVFQGTGTPPMCYGPPVTSVATGRNPISPAVTNLAGTGADASTDATGLIITMPNATTGSGAATHLWLSEQPTPVAANLNLGTEPKPGTYHGAAVITGRGNSGTPTAYVTVASGKGYVGNLIGQDYVLGDATCYDPSSGSATGGTKGPISYPYKHHVYAYDANELALVKAGSLFPDQVLPYAEWDYTLPIIYSERRSFRGAAFDTINSRLYVVQANMTALNEIAIAVFTVTNPAPEPAPVPALGPPATWQFVLGFGLVAFGLPRRVRQWAA